MPKEVSQATLDRTVDKFLEAILEAPLNVGYKKVVEESLKMKFKTFTTWRYRYKEFDQQITKILDTRDELREEMALEESFNERTTVTTKIQKTKGGQVVTQYRSDNVHRSKLICETVKAMIARRQGAIQKHKVEMTADVTTDAKAPAGLLEVYASLMANQDQTNEEG